jgi:RNA polymerase sigma-70 factor (ECF subfamily)
MDIVDEQLVTSASNGDASAYSSLFEKYQGGIYNFAYSLVRSPEDAKDIAQEAFIKVFEALPRLQEGAKFSSYLYRTARNLAMDELKKQKRFGAPDQLDLEKDDHIYSDPQRSLLLQEQQSDVRKAAANLADDYRMVLALRELQDLSYDEISSVMEIPKNSVGVLLLRARLKFKQEFRMSQVDVEKLSKECKEMLPLLSAYVDNELSDEERQRVQRHLDDCPLCRLTIEEMTDSSKSYRGFIPVLPPPDLKANVFARIKNQLTGKFEFPGNEASNTSAQAGSGVTREMSAQDIPTLEMEPVKGSTEQVDDSPKDIAEKGRSAKAAGLSTAKKILIVGAAVFVIGGGAATGLAGIYSLWSNAHPAVGDLVPYNHDLPGALMEEVPKAEEDMTVDESEPTVEEPDETQEDSKKPSSSHSHGTEDVNPVVPDENPQNPGDETTTPPPDENGGTPTDPDKDPYDPQYYRAIPLYPKLEPIRPVDPIDTIE